VDTEMKRTAAPTDRQLEALKFIGSYRAENGYSPSMDEISRHMRVSIARGWKFVSDLVELGLLKNTKHISRSTVITPAGEGILTAGQELGG